MSSVPDCYGFPDDQVIVESMTVQEAHHKIVPFQIELTRILDEHEMDYDEQELWS